MSRRQTSRRACARKGTETPDVFGEGGGFKGGGTTNEWVKEKDENRASLFSAATHPATRKKVICGKPKSKRKSASRRIVDNIPGELKRLKNGQNLRRGSAYSGPSRQEWEDWGWKTWREGG